MPLLEANWITLNEALCTVEYTVHVENGWWRIWVGRNEDRRVYDQGGPTSSKLVILQLHQVVHGHKYGEASQSSEDTDDGHQDPPHYFHVAVRLYQYNVCGILLASMGTLSP